MSNTIIELRHSYVTGNVPSSLANGEIAINTYDGKLFYRGGASNTIQTIERYEGPAGLDTEVQFNDSGVLGSSANLSFNKNNNTLSTKNVSANLISFKTDGVVPIELLVDNTVSSFTYTGKSFSISGQESGPTGVHFKPDGTKMFVMGSTGDDINEYSLSTPWEVTTASFTRVTSALTDTAPASLRFSSDGTSAYVLGDTNDRIYQHTLTEAWNVATLNTTATNSFNVATQETSPSGLWFKPDGTKMYVVGTSGDDINEYDLSTAGNVATATFVQTKILPEDTGPSSVAFDETGTRLFVSGTTGEEINEYFLSTAWDVSTLKWIGHCYTGFQSADPTGIFPAISNNFFYVISSSGDAVYQYSTNSNSLLANTHNFNINGNVSVGYNQTIVGSQFVQSSHTVYGTSTLSTTSVSGTLTGSSTLSLTGATNSTTLVGTAATTGTMRVGGSTQTGEIAIGISTQNQTLNIANGQTTSTNTKTIYIGASGLSSSQTNVFIGSTIFGSRGNTFIFTPNVTFTSSNTSQTKVSIEGTQSSISNSTGALIVAGGVGVSGNVYAGNVATSGYIQFSDGTKQYTANAGSGGGTTDQVARNTANAAFIHANAAFDAANTGGGGSANSFGQVVANVGTILATSANDSIEFVGESGISVSSNVSAKKVIVSVPAGYTFTTADYGFVYDSTNVIYDYGTL